MTMDVSLIVAAAGGLFAGLVLGYLLRSYVSYRRRRRRARAPLHQPPLSPPKAARGLAAASLAPSVEGDAGLRTSQDVTEAKR